VFSLSTPHAPSVRFVVLASCGCVITERVIKEIPTKRCLACEKPFEEDDVILLNADEAETAELVKRLLQRRHAEAAAKVVSLSLSLPPPPSRCGVR
jgi:replication termination factor 2